MNSEHSKVINTTAANRSRMYCVLSLAFRYPIDAQGIKLDPTTIANDIREIGKSLPYGLKTLNEGFSQQIKFEYGSLDLPVTHTNLFDNCAGRARVSLHEKDYTNEDPKLLWEDIIRFYEFFGLDYDLRTCNEWPDWIGLELEFMHYLTFLEAGARVDVASGYLLAQADFLARHLARWAPLFAERLNAATNSDFYRFVGNVFKEFVLADASYTQEAKSRAA